MKTILQARILSICFLLFLIFVQHNDLFAQGAGYALDFDGIDDYVSVTSGVGDELNPQNAVTVESWVYLAEPASATHTPHYLGKGGSYQLIIEDTGQPRFFAVNAGTYYSSSATTIVEVGKWYHIAGTFDGTDIRIYVNGMMEGVPHAVPAPLEQNSVPVRFGNRNGGNEALAGLMDEIRIWDVAKNETELQDGMNKKLVGNEANLVGYWRLDETSGTTASDLTANGNDGTLTNMDGDTDWITSIAPIGDNSIFAESLDISETTDCEVDVIFGIGADAPGSGYSLAAVQVNDSPNSTTGLMYTLADLYWEIWSETGIFDGDFTATVQFHYDNVSGITDEANLVLYKRDSANVTGWSSVTGYTIVSDDGGSSTAGDGIGYVQLDITEATSGGFGGQYILGWNIPPVANIDNAVTEEDTLVVIDVLDNDTDSDGTLDPSTVSITADPSNGTITDINATTGEISYMPDANYNGSDQFSYTVDDDAGATSNVATVSLTINSVNDLPDVGEIPGESVAEGEIFATISLDDYVTDVEDADADISWTWSGNTDLTVSIDGSRVVTIGIPDENWNGSETILFTAEDLDGGQDSDTATFTVTPVNDFPVVTDIPGQTIAEGEVFATISLDDYVTDVEDADADIVWTWSGNTDLTVSLDGNRVATISIPDENWNGSEIITFTATDQDGDSDEDTVAFNVTPVNDLPVVTDIPSQTILEGDVFATINLDDYVSDIEDTDDNIVWDWAGNTDLIIAIDGNRVATITVPNANWNGAETITFTAIDQDGGEASDPATFTVTADNDPPIVTDIPDQTIDEGGTFDPINLDDYVSDVEDADANIIWTWSGNTDLIVSIDANRVATISVPDENWNGVETITFMATDLIGESASDAAIFTVNPVNNSPELLTQIPDTIAVTLEEFMFQFDSLTFGDIDEGDTLTYSASLTTGDLPDWLSFDDESRTFSGTPGSSDIGTISVVVTAIDLDMETATDTFDIQVMRGPLGIQDLTQEWKFNVYPNPSDGHIFVNMSIPENEDIEMRIFNASGQLVRREGFQNQFGNVRLTVNLSNQKKGIYLIRVISQSGVANKQVVIH